METCPVFTANAERLEAANPNVFIDLKDLLSAKASILRPSDGKRFEEAIDRPSTWGAPQFAIAVLPDTEEDIVRTVAYARKTGISFHPSNTGHAWAALNETIKNGLLLKLSSLKKLEVSEDRKTITVGAGVTVKDVNAVAYSHGRQLTIGSCNCVGLLGASLGGGHGRLQGYYGLMGDGIVSARLLLASGDIITVSNEEHSDLFWALKGAGHNFGIVLEATYRLHELVDGGDVYNANKVFEPEKIEEVFNNMNTASPVPKETSIYLGYLFYPPVAKVVLLVDYVYMGPGGKAQGREKFDEIFGNVTGIAEWDAVHPWNKLNQDGAAGITAAFCNREPRMKNSFTASLLTYDLPSMRKLYDVFSKLMEGNPELRESLIALESYPQEGVRAVDPGSTAYPHRDANHLVLIQIRFNDPALDGPTTAVGEELRDILFAKSGFSERRTYMNYCRGDESLEDKYGYESWRLDRLRTLKAKYDPTGFFTSYHPIGPPGPEPGICSSQSPSV